MSGGRLAGRKRKKKDLDEEIGGGSALPEAPNPDDAKVTELTAYCKEADRWPGGDQAAWKAMKAPEKRKAFKREFLPDQAKTDTFDPRDPIHLLANEAENVEPPEIEDKLRDLEKARGDQDFLIGGILSVVVAKSLFRQWGFETFKAWVHARTGFAIRKANHLVRNYNRLVDLDIPYAKFGDIGWQKIGMLLSVVTPDTVDEWAFKAKEMDIPSLDEEIKEAKKAASGGDGEGSGKAASNLHQKAFKLHSDQKDTVNDALAQMKEEYPTEHDNVALEAICARYLSGELGQGRMAPALDSVRDCLGQILVAIKKAQELEPDGLALWEEILEPIEELFPEWRIDVTPIEKNSD